MSRATSQALGRAFIHGLVAALGGQSACGNSDSPATPSPSPPSSSPSPRPSQDFRTWTAFHDDGPAAGLGHRRTCSARAPSTSTRSRSTALDQFSRPGTKPIVEAREAGAQLIFAAVKRGNNYDAAGAVNWEWFELQENGDGDGHHPVARLRPARRLDDVRRLGSLQPVPRGLRGE